MSDAPRHGLVALAGLPPALLPEVQALAARCNRAEGLDLKLNLIPERSTEAELADRFLYFEQGALVGFLGLDGTPEVELCGCVDPAYRRRGIGSLLLAAASEICKQRGLASVLVICEQASRSGKAFLAPLAAPIRSAEYRMRCAVSSWPPPRRPLELREAGPGDLPALARIIGSAFGNPPEVVEQRIKADLLVGGQRYFIGVSDGRPVSGLKLFFENGRAYVYAFGVAAELRGGGYGRATLVQTLEMLRDGGWPEVLLEVDVDNEVALNLYRRCGFDIITQYDYHALDLRRPAEERRA